MFKGVVIGFSIAAPVGPIGILCIRRSLTEGRLAGFISGLGAATADAVYGLIAGMGITVLVQFLTKYTTIFQLVGGSFLAYLGLKILMSPISDTSVTAEKTQIKLGSAYLLTFILTLSNPMTIFSFAAILLGVGIGQSSGDQGSMGLFVGGVFAGSSLWWLTLSGLAGMFRSRINQAAMRVINYISGIIIVGFAVWILWKLV